MFVDKAANPRCFKNINRGSFYYGVVSHAPREYSGVFWRFLQQGGGITCEVDGGRQFGRGLEVPCVYTFHGKKAEVKKIMKKFPRLEKDPLTER